MPSAQHQVTIDPPSRRGLRIRGGWAQWTAVAARRPRHLAPLGEQNSSAVYKQGVKGPGGRRIDADYRIASYEPDRRLAFMAIAGPVRPTGSYTFEVTGAGTRLTFELHAELGGIKKLLMSGAVQKTMDAEVGATERLKTVLESDSAT